MIITVEHSDKIENLTKSWVLRRYAVTLWSNKTKQAIQLGYANRIIYSNILFDLKKRTKYI